MKRIKAAWIEQLIEFDSADELNKFIEQLNIKKKKYYILWQRGTSTRIRIQYNNNSMDMKEGE